MEPWKKNLYFVGVAQLMGFATLNFVMSFLPLYIKSLGVSDPGAAAVWSGVLMGATAFFAAISGPIWGNIGDRYGRKAMVERVLFCVTLIVVLMGFVSNVWQMLVLRSVQGALGGFAAASIALVTSITPAAQIGFALGFYQFALTAGTALGPLLGGYLADTLSFRTAFIIMSGFTLAAALVVRFLVYEKFTPPKQNVKQESFFSILGHLLGSRTLLSMLLVNTMVQFSLFMAVPVLPLFIHSLDPESTRITTMTGLIIAAGGVSTAVSAIFLGRVGDRVGYKRVLIVCTLGAAVASILQAPVSSPWQFLALRIIGGVFTGGMLPCATAIINNLIPREQKGTAFGISTSFSLIGVVFAPISGGLIGASPLGYRGVYVITAALLFLTAIWIKTTVKDHAPQSIRLGVEH